MKQIINSTKFELGQVVATCGVQKKMDENFYFSVAVRKCLDRHYQCDWGDLCKEDKASNEKALKGGARLFSAYEINPKIWIITEWDRSVTTILLPEEY